MEGVLFTAATDIAVAMATADIVVMDTDTVVAGVATTAGGTVAGDGVGAGDAVASGSAGTSRYCRWAMRPITGVAFPTTTPIATITSGIPRRIPTRQWIRRRG